MIFSKSTPAVLTTILLVFTSIGSALACSTAGWDEESGMVAVGQPFGATPPDIDGVSRYEESCALVATDTGHVQTNSPSHTEVWNLVYVLPNFTGGGSTEILVGYSDEAGTAELFNIGFDGANFTFDVTGGGSDSFAAQAGWNWIEYHWDGATFEFWVNADSADPALGSFAAAGGTLESVRLGLPNGLGGFGGMVNFDTFVMHNTTRVGPVPNCDANGDMAFNVLDLLSAVNEINEVNLAPGTPDCNFSGGALNVLDLLAIVNVINAQ